MYSTILALQTFLRKCYFAPDSNPGDEGHRLANLALRNENYFYNYIIVKTNLSCFVKTHK